MPEVVAEVAIVMRSRSVFLALAVTFLIVLGLAAYLWNGFHGEVHGFGLSASSFSSEPERVKDLSPEIHGYVESASEAELTASKTKPARLHSAANNAALQQLVAKLSSKNTNRWMAGAKGLAKLEASKQWRALSATGVADQAVSKALRRDMVTACSVRMGKVRARGGSGITSAQQIEDNAVAPWCESLLDAHPVDYYFESLRAGVQDAELLSPDVFVPGFQEGDLEDTERDDWDALLIQMLKTANNSVKIQQVVLELWGSHSRLFAREWGRVASLSRFQQDRMQQALAALVACRASLSCGPRSIITIHYCALMPGAHCRPGQSLDTALRLGLSQFEYRLLQDMARRALVARRT